MAWNLDSSALELSSVQGCNLTGPLPTNWSSAAPLATGAYINLYPVNINLSRNRLTVISVAEGVIYMSGDDEGVTSDDLRRPLRPTTLSFD